MKRISSCFILSFLFLLILSQLSYAEPKDPINIMDKGFQDEGTPPMIPPIMPCDRKQKGENHQLLHPYWPPLQSLKLDGKQKEALKEIETGVAKELIKKKADEQIAEIELREILDKDAVDLKAVETKLKQIAAIRTETQLIAIKSMEKMKAVLTSVQREMLKKIRPMAQRTKAPLKRELLHDETKMPPHMTQKHEFQQ
jgi:Spy/CpxP family protein refolding chaperone